MENDMDNLKVLKKNIKEIENMIDTCRKENKNSFDTEMTIMTELPELYQQYPFLVKKLSKSDDKDYLNKFIESLEQVVKGNKSLASVELNLGLELKKQYIDSVIDKNK